MATGEDHQLAYLVRLTRLVGKASSDGMHIVLPDVRGSAG